MQEYAKEKQARGCLQLEARTLGTTFRGLKPVNQLTTSMNLRDGCCLPLAALFGAVRRSLVLGPPLLGWTPPWRPQSGRLQLARSDFISCDTLKLASRLTVAISAQVHDL